MYVEEVDEHVGHVFLSPGVQSLMDLAEPTTGVPRGGVSV